MARAWLPLSLGLSRYMSARTSGFVGTNARLRRASAVTTARKTVRVEKAVDSGLFKGLEVYTSRGAFPGTPALDDWGSMRNQVKQDALQKTSTDPTRTHDLVTIGPYSPPSHSLWPPS
jgi:glycine cleavage system aminomethyltransferase T